MVSTGTAANAPGRVYRSKKQRPCDFCRQQKICCIINGEPPCVACAKKGRACTFDKPVKRRHAKSPGTSPKIKIYNPTKEKTKRRKKSELSPTIPMDLSFSQDSHATLDSPMEPHSPAYEFDLPLTIDMWNLMLQGLDTSEAPATVPTSRFAGTLNSNSSFHMQTQGINRFGICSIDQILHFLKGSVDADESIKIQYVAENCYMDPFVLSKMVSHEHRTDPFPRVLGSSTHLHLPNPLILAGQDPGPSRHDVEDKAKITRLIGEFGPRLLLIYFRFINPCLPLFSRDLFYFGTNQNMLEFHNSLVATLLTLAMDLWDVDPVLQKYTPPSDVALFKIATTTLMEEQEWPNYSSLQACILLSQKRPVDISKPDTPMTWSLLGMASSMATTMGYNYDPLEWNIPNWDKKMRRRIWWSFVVQDTWFAACYGRPPHIPKRHYHVSRLTMDDFEVYTMNENDNKNFQLSVTSFCFVVELTTIVIDICNDLLFAQTTYASLETLYTVGVSLLDKVIALEEDCPVSLSVSSRETYRVAWANGSIQLAIQSAKILVLKYLLHRQSKSECTQKIQDYSVDCLRKCVNMFQELRAVDFQHFWYSWSRLNFALVSNFFLLVYSTGSQRTVVKDTMDTYRWWLRCNASVSRDLKLALVVLDNAYTLGLDRL